MKSQFSTTDLLAVAVVHSALRLHQWHVEEEMPQIPLEVLQSVPVLSFDRMTQVSSCLSRAPLRRIRHSTFMRMFSQRKYPHKFVPGGCFSHFAKE
jgi:hypothetical protein